MPFLESDFALRPMTYDDMELVLIWRNKQHIRDNMYTDHKISSEEHQKWFEKVLGRTDVDYQIFEYLGQPLGSAYITGIDSINCKSYWGFYLGEDKGPRGVGAVMEYFVLAYIFENLEIRKLNCEVFAFNKPTIKLHKRFGFNEEGCLRKHIMKSSKFEDVIIMALFSEGWPDIKKTMRKIFFS